MFLNLSEWCDAFATFALGLWLAQPVESDSELVLGDESIAPARVLNTRGEVARFTRCLVFERRFPVGFGW